MTSPPRNVWEWIRSCAASAGAADACPALGGSFDDSAPNLSCDPPDSDQPRDLVDGARGFRCRGGAP